MISGAILLVAGFAVFLAGSFVSFGSYCLGPTVNTYIAGSYCAGVSIPWTAILGSVLAVFGAVVLLVPSR